MTQPARDLSFASKNQTKTQTTKILPENLTCPSLIFTFYHATCKQTRPQNEKAI
jgi:hypothetical protein